MANYIIYHSTKERIFLDFPYTVSIVADGKKSFLGYECGPTIDVEKLQIYGS